MTEPEIALAFTPEPWVEELHRFLSDHGGARVRQLVLDPDLVLEDPADTLVASHRWPGLTARLVADLHAYGRTVLGVFDRDEPAGAEFLREVGSDAVIESDAGPRAFVDVLTALRPVFPPASGAAPDGGRSRPPRRGVVVVVGGPGGAGATEVALHLAADAALRETCVLVDADEVAPCLAQRLGFPLEPNLRSAVDEVEFGSGDLGAHVVARSATRPAALAGFPRASAWAHVRPGEVVRVVRALAGGFGAAIVDIASALEDLATAPRGRYAVTRALLGEADVLVAVGTASPVGIARLVDWANDARVLALDAPLHIVMNRVPRSAYQRAEVRDEIARALHPVACTVLPDDHRVGDAAWRGTLARRGPFTRAVRGLATAVQSDVARVVREGSEVSA